jgi:6-hydroxynicotinate 3-monooxygenase
MSTQRLSVAIIGAGMGGLTAAATLRNIGVDVQVYEQATRFARVGAGIQMSPNAMHVLRAIGLEPKLRETAFNADYVHMREWDTGVITNDYPHGKWIEETYGAPYLQLHRADLHSILVENLPNDIVHLDKKLVGLDQNAHGTQLIFSDGSTARADAVVASDGVHSLVRKLLYGEERIEYTGRVGYRATFPTALMGGPVIDDNVKWWGVDRHIVNYYTNPQRDEVYFVTATPDPDFTVESWSAKGDMQQLRAAYEGFHPQVQTLLAACPECHKWALVSRNPLPSWSDGRIVLLGDAAHTMPPWMAQGAAMAIEDGAVLARCLDGVDSDGIAQAFRRFSAARIDRTSTIQTVSKNNTFNRLPGGSHDWVYGYNAWTVALPDA